MGSGAERINPTAGVGSEADVCSASHPAAYMLRMTGRDLVLLYLATGNEDAGRIVREAARAAAKLEPRKVRRKRLKDG